jgi:hypothetical protein
MLDNVSLSDKSAGDTEVQSVLSDIIVFHPKGSARKVHLTA